MRRHALVLAAIVLAVPVVRAGQPSAPPVRKGAPRLELRLSTTTPRLAPGTIPDFRVEMRNVGDTPVRLVMPGDGSMAGWRTPTVRWIKDAKTDRFIGCGTMNGITLDEVFTLPPGETRALTGWIAPPRLKPGRNRVAILYANTPATPYDLLHSKPDRRDEDAATRACRETAAVRVRSNTVEVVDDRPRGAMRLPTRGLSW